MIKFYKVTQAQYDALTEPETDAIYFTSDTMQIYAGNKDYSQSRLHPVTKIITLDPTAANAEKLNHAQYSRWEFSGSGEISISAMNWDNGDRGELLVNTELQTVSCPSTWIKPDNFDITTSPGVYLLGIRRENNDIYMYQLLPFQA